MKITVVLIAIAIGAYLASVFNGGTGSAPIDALHGIDRQGVLLLLGLFLFGALWHFGTAIGRYHKSGDPKQIYYVTDVKQGTAYTGDTVRMED